MSGRTRVTLSDGRRVIGYRKTLRRQAPRTASHLLPFWILSFELPGMLGIGLMPGDYPGIIGVSICGPRGHVEIKGKNHGWCYEQAIALLREIAPGGLPNPLAVRMTRENEPGPTISGPLRRGDDRVIEIEFNGRQGRIIHNTAMRPVPPARPALPQRWR